MKLYNPIKAEDRIMNEPLTKNEQKFVDSFTLDDKDFLEILEEELDSEYEVIE